LKGSGAAASESGCFGIAQALNSAATLNAAMAVRRCGVKYGVKRATRRAEELWSMASFLFKLAKA
jgi:hypothetical protein